MRALLERSRSARAAVAALSAACVLGLVHAADAGDDLGIRRATFMPEGLFTALGLSAPAPVRAPEAEPILLAGPAPKHRHSRRIWAATRGRPLRVALQHPGKRGTTAKTASRTTRPAPALDTVRLVPPPTRTALVSIYEDRTLRSGDAVMLGDGVHVFRDDGFWPHRPRDFVRLRTVASLDWHLRQTLAPYDNNPPTRWTSIMVPPA